MTRGVGRSVRLVRGSARTNSHKVVPVSPPKFSQSTSTWPDLKRRRGPRGAALEAARFRGSRASTTPPSVRGVDRLDGGPDGNPLERASARPFGTRVDGGIVHDDGTLHPLGRVRPLLRRRPRRRHRHRHPLRGLGRYLAQPKHWFSPTATPPARPPDFAVPFDVDPRADRDGVARWLADILRALADTSRDASDADERAARLEAAGVQANALLSRWRDASDADARSARLDASSRRARTRR